MNNKDYAIAVIDIGKTNKRVAVFSSELKLIHSESTQIGEIIAGGFLSDDIPKINGWILKKLKQFFHQYPIKVISTATFGATIALLDWKGDLVFPVISYEEEPGSHIKEKFFKAFGNKEHLYLKTGTPLGAQLLNAGLQLFYLMEKKPQKFSKIKHLLFLPQYIGYLLTGEKAIEYTSLGCHTFFYNFDEMDWSEVAKKMKVDRMSPKKFSKPWDILGKISPQLSVDIGLDKGCKVAVGLHDTSSSLLPYLLCRKGDFILASTGTWCEFIYPGVDFRPSVGDLDKNILYYIDPFGRPVKAIDFKGGEQHDHYADLIKKKFNVDPAKIELNVELLKSILKSANCFIIFPSTFNSQKFSKVVGEDYFYQRPDFSYHVLCLSLAVRSYFAIKQIVGEKKGLNIFVEGGFRKNKIYLKSLSALFPEHKIFTSELQEATSLGAAICGKCAYEGVNPSQLNPDLININEKPIERLYLEENLIKQYVNRFKHYRKENNGQRFNK